MNYLIQFSETMKELMLSKNYDVKTLSQITEIKSSRIYDFVKGAHFPSVANAIKLSQALDCCVDYLFGLSDKKILTTNTYNLDRHARLVKQFDSCNLTRYKISKILKINESQLARWYKGNSAPQIFSFICLCEVFNCSLEYLILD